MKNKLVWLGLGLLGAIAVRAEGDAAKTRELLAILNRPAAELFDRTRACQQLAISGTDAAIPALAALLGDDKLAHYAREALEAMARPAADAALRSALGRVQGPHLVGVVNSLGVRRDAAATGALRSLAEDARSPAAGAALLALGRIGTPEAVAVVRRGLDSASESTRTFAAEAALLHADRLLARSSGDAVAWYDAVRNAAVGGQLKLSALRGAILARGAAGVGLLVESLGAADPAVQAVGLRAARDLAAPEVTTGVVAAMDRLSPAVQALAIGALVDRGDARARSMIEQRTQATDPAVRLAALRALGRIGADSSTPLLVQALQSSASPAELEAAQRSLSQIAAPAADDAIVRALGTAPAAARVRLVAVLADRAPNGAAERLLALARDSDPAVARAALRGLAQTAKPADLPALIRLSAGLAEDESRTLADRAVYLVSMKILEPERRADPVLGAFRAAGDAPTRAALLRPLGAVVRGMGGNHAARDLVVQALADGDEAVRTAAAKCLSDWPDASVAATLLEFVQRAPDAPQRAVAFEGAVRLTTEAAAGRDRTAIDVIRHFTELNALARTDRERMSVVAGLGSVRRIEAYRLLVPYLDVPAVRTEAALSIVQIAPALLGGREAATLRATLQRIAEAEKDADVRSKAAQLLKGDLPPAKKGKAKQK